MKATQDETLRTARVFCDFAFYKVALCYPHLTFNFDRLEFDDLVLPPTSKFYHENFAATNSTDSFYLKKATRHLLISVNLHPLAMEIRGTLSSPIRITSQLPLILKGMVPQERGRHRWSRNPMMSDEMLALLLLLL